MSYTLYLNGTKVNQVFVVGEHDYTTQPTEIPAPTLISSGGGGVGTGGTPCNGRKSYQWLVYIETPDVEGVTYYLNWVNADNATTLPADPTTTTYDDTLSYDPQAGYSEADSKCVYILHICEEDIVGAYVNFKVIGVKNGYVSDISIISIEHYFLIQ